MTTALQTALKHEAEDLAASFDALVLLLADETTATDQSLALLHWMRGVQGRLDGELRRRGATPELAVGRRQALALAGD